MSFIAKIGAILSADTAEFRDKMNQAGDVAEGLDKKLKKFGVGFGGVAALAKWFGETLDHARNLTGVLDENQSAAKRFAEGVDGVKKTFLDVSVTAMGFVNTLGEWWGRAYAVRQQGEAQVALQEQIAKQTEETLRTIESQKKIGAELGALRVKAREVEAQIVADKEKQLALEAQIINAQTKVAMTAEAIAAAGNDQREVAKAQLANAEARLALSKLMGQQAKEVATEEKKAADEQAKLEAKAEEDRVNAHIAEMDRITAEKEAKRAALKAEGEAQMGLTGGLEEQLRFLEKQGTAQSQIVATLKGRGFEEADILAKLTKQTEQLNFQTTIKSKGLGDTDLSDRALEDKVRNLSAGIAAIDRDVLGARYNTSTRAQMQKELDFARDELGDRSRIRGQVAQFGEEGAARLYAGQIDQFERLLKFVNPQDSQQRTAAGVEELNERLSSLFPKRR